MHDTELQKEYGSDFTIHKLSNYTDPFTNYPSLVHDKLTSSSKAVLSLTLFNQVSGVKEY